MSKPRTASVSRKTKETDISIDLVIDGTGKTDINTGVPFLDHMLDAFGRHGLFDLVVRADGDTHIDDHHTVEDTGIVLGQAFAKALGDRKGITRFGDAVIPMDEALVLAAVDISGRGQLHFALDIFTPLLGTFDSTLVKEFFIAFASNAGLTLHLYQFAGDNTHHVFEAAFKACARALLVATALDRRVEGVPSTKGTL